MSLIIDQNVKNVNFPKATVLKETKIYLQLGNKTTGKVANSLCCKFTLIAQATLTGP